MKTILLLVGSNIFMTLAWYGQLRFKWLEAKPLFLIILISWGIAFFEYCLMVPANRSGYFSGNFSGYQLKILQECITLAVFTLFAFCAFGQVPKTRRHAGATAAIIPGSRAARCAGCTRPSPRR